MPQSKLTSSSAALMAPPRMIIVFAMLMLVGSFMALLVWSALAELEKVVLAEGRVVPSGDIRIVQNLEGGIIGDILVSSGQQVEAGDPLIQISSVGFDAEFSDTQQRIDSLTIDIIRLTAQIDNTELVYSEALETSRPNLVRQARQLHRSRLKDLSDSLSGFDSIITQRESELASLRRNIRTLEESRELLNIELNRLRPLLPDGVISETEYSSKLLERNSVQADLETAKGTVASVMGALAQIRQQRQDRINLASTETLEQRNEKELERASLEQVLRASSDKVERTLVRAPVSGVVNRLLVNTEGGVIQPGEDLLEIVPAKETLLIEARVRPEDIAFVQAGQKAFIQLTAYDFAVYGGLTGSVELVGADTVEERDKDLYYYAVRIRTQTATLERHGRSYPVLPGMVARVDLITGKRTVLDYLLKPITRLKERALRER